MKRTSTTIWTAAAAVVMMMTGGVNGQVIKRPAAKVSFDDFKQLVAEVEGHRAARMIDLDTFLRMSREEGVVVLDARSAFRFERIRMKGAKSLPFTDFTQENLAKLIPDPGTKILIYCNNNCDGNQRDFASKMFVPSLELQKSQVVQQEKPRMLALNIPTYINLYGYGYRNVYELNELVGVRDPRVEFEGTTVEKKAATSEEGVQRLRSLIKQKAEPAQGG
jgi:rhodanese-related sulfurtransferase